MLQQGTVVKSTGSWYLVQLDHGEKVGCRILGKFRLEGQKITNPVAVGDRVEVQLVNEDNQIKRILPRQNYVARQSPRKKHDLHLLASNIDQALLVVTMVSPDLKPAFIDRFLLMTEPRDIPAIIVFNKWDLYDEEDREMFRIIQFVYTEIGYCVIAVSAMTGAGIEELKLILKDKTTLIAGQSGVGKSSILNTIQPQLDLRTGGISDYSGKGQHTTTFAEMHELDFGGNIIDTPGIKTLAFNNMEIMDVAHNFKEFFKFSSSCKFSNCTHRNEPGCAIKEAIGEHQISELRYQNYLQILQEIEDQNYWERLNM